MEQVERHELKAAVWLRTSVEPNEWVLEISGAINDVSFDYRHTQSTAVEAEDVAALPELYTTNQAKDEEIARGHAAIWLLASIHKAMDAFEAGDFDTAGVDADAWKEASRALIEAHRG